MMDEKRHTEVPEDAPETSAERSSRDKNAKERSGMSPRARRIAVIAGILVVLGVVGFGIWWFSGGQDDFFDANALEGQAPYKTPEEIQAELDRIVEEGMFNISIASVIQFDDGTKSGKAYIENVPGNRYYMQVTITLDDGGDTVFETKAIKPGQ